MEDAVCCGESADYKKREAERLAQEKADMNRVVEINGVKLKIKDMFTDHWQARDFISKLNLIEKSSGGKILMDTEPSSIMDEAA